MEGSPYIQVILPLRLAWEPYYSCGIRLQVGDRVRVPFSGRDYIGVVSAVDVTPSVSRVLPVREAETGMERIFPEEIAFWRQLSDYYLCPIGEIYRAAHPLGVTDDERRAALRRKQRQERLALRREALLQKAEAMKERLSAVEAALESVRKGTKREAALLESADKLRLRIAAALDESAGLDLGLTEEAGGTFPAAEATPSDLPEGRVVSSIKEAFSSRKTVLLHGGTADERTVLYRALARETLEGGRNVLLLFPDAGSARRAAASFGERGVFYDPVLTSAARRQVSEALGRPGGCLVAGTRSSLLLPLRNLGLVVVENEHEGVYKWDHSPRYQARDAALILARLQGADAVLGSATPSLESLYNVAAGRFAAVHLPVRLHRAECVDLPAEKRKRGVRGECSFKMLSAIRRALDQGREVSVLTIWKDSAPAVEETLREEFPGRSGLSCMPLNAYKGGGSAERFLVLVHGDALLSREDFRSDERALQILLRLAQEAPLLVQAKNTEHPVFQALTEGSGDVSFLMEERRALNYPPFSRMIRIVVEDDHENRLALMSSRLSGALSGLPGAPRVTGPVSPGNRTGERHLTVLLPRTAALAATKQAILQTISSLERDSRYTGHIFVDVDP